VRRKHRKRKNRPNPVDPDTIAAFEKSVSPGHYMAFDPSSKPEGLPSAGKNCRRIVVAASFFSGVPLQGVDPSDIPQGPVYLWRAFRTGSSISQPHKVDDALYYRTANGTPLALHSKRSPDHHSQIASASGLQGIIESYSLPPASEGTLADYRQLGANLEFETPFKSTGSS